MNKSYVLVAVTAGDDLIGPATSVVATSDDREKLETLRNERAAEREAFLAENSLPQYAMGSVISKEEIREVLAV